MTRVAAAVLAVALALPAVAADAPDPAKTYRVSTDGSTRALEVGKKGKVVVDVVPLEKGIHVNREFPLKYKVEPSAGLKVEKLEWKRADAVNPDAENPRFEIPFTAAAKGAQQISVAMRFAICSDAWCVPQTRTVTVPVEVK